MELHFHLSDYHIMEVQVICQIELVKVLVKLDINLKQLRFALKLFTVYPPFLVDGVSDTELEYLEDEQYV